jgi:hypothetical protein
MPSSSHKLSPQLGPAASTRPRKPQHSPCLAWSCICHRHRHHPLLGAIAPTGTTKAKRRYRDHLWTFAVYRWTYAQTVFNAGKRAVPGHWRRVWLRQCWAPEGTCSPVFYFATIDRNRFSLLEFFFRSERQKPCSEAVASCGTHLVIGILHKLRRSELSPSLSTSGGSRTLSSQISLHS